MLELDPKTTALVLIDLQKGIMGHELKPYPADRVAKASSTLAVKTMDIITRIAMTVDVKRFSFRPFTHGPSTSRSLHSSSRNTVAEGSSTPARVCTPSVIRPSGEPGIRTMVAATKHDAGRLPDLERQLRRDDAIGAAADAVCAEILTHGHIPCPASCRGSHAHGAITVSYWQLLQKM